MIIVRKNVYKVFDTLKMFSSLKDVWKVLVFVLKIARMFWFENEQATKSKLPTQMSFLFIFFSFDIVVLPLIW